MVGKLEVHPSSVNVQGLSQNAAGHHRALNMPAWTTLNRIESNIYDCKDVKIFKLKGKRNAILTESLLRTYLTQLLSVLPTTWLIVNIKKIFRFEDKIAFYCKPIDGKAFSSIIQFQKMKNISELYCLKNIYAFYSSVRVSYSPLPFPRESPTRARQACRPSTGQSRWHFSSHSYGPQIYSALLQQAGCTQFTRSTYNFFIIGFAWT